VTFVNHITLLLEGCKENMIAENVTVVSTERAEMRLSYREGYQVGDLVLYLSIYSNIRSRRFSAAPLQLISLGIR
jgi:hypothetical protein